MIEFLVGLFVFSLISIAIKIIDILNVDERIFLLLYKFVIMVGLTYMMGWVILSLFGLR